MHTRSNALKLSDGQASVASCRQRRRSQTLCALYVLPILFVLRITKNTRVDKITRLALPFSRFNTPNLQDILSAWWHHPTRLALSNTRQRFPAPLCILFTLAFSTLPADVSSSLVGLRKTNSSLVSMLLSTLSRKNNLIYHALILAPEFLPKIYGSSLCN